jgi:hypothetical protein
VMQSGRIRERDVEGRGTRVVVAGAAEGCGVGTASISWRPLEGFSCGGVHGFLPITVQCRYCSHPNPLLVLKTLPNFEN